MVDAKPQHLVHWLALWWLPLAPLLPHQPLGALRLVGLMACGVAASPTPDHPPTTPAMICEAHLMSHVHVWWVGLSHSYAPWWAWHAPSLPHQDVSPLSAPLGQHPPDLCFHLGLLPPPHPAPNLCFHLSLVPPGAPHPPWVALWLGPLLDPNCALSHRWLANPQNAWPRAPVLLV